MTRSLVHFERVSSTNDVAKRIAALGHVGAFAVAAGEQTNGRGRRGREWHSAPGGAWVSIAVPWTADMAHTPLAVRLAVAELVEETIERDAHIKWPNDVLIGGSKVAGILCERDQSVAPNRSIRPELVVGIGVNVNNPLPEIERGLVPASLSSLVGRPVELEPFVRSLTDRVAKTLQPDGLSAEQVEAINARLAYRDEVVTVHAEGRDDWWGVLRRVAADGALVVERDGVDEQVRSGEATLRAGWTG